MPDISTLFQASPGIAGYFAGQNQASNLATEDARRMDLQTLANSRQLQDQREMEMHPLAMQLKQLDAQKQQEDMPRIAAEARLKRQEADIGDATMGSAIDQKNFENRMKVHTQLGMQLGTLSQAIAANPGVPPHVALQQELQQANLPPQAIQGLMQKYANVPPQMLAKKLQEDAAFNQRQTAAYAQAMDLQKLQEQGANSRNAATIQGQKDLEQMRIDAGKYNRKNMIDTVDSRLLKAKNAAEKAEILEAAYYDATAKGDTDLAASFKARALEARQRAVEDGSVRAGAAQAGKVNAPAVANLPANPAPTAAAPIAGGGQAPGVGAAGKGQRVMVIAPDGSRGTIPVEQLDKALGKGYKKAN